MTRSKFGITIVLAFAVLSTTVVFAQQTGGSYNSHDKQVHSRFVDENGDGLNDNVRHTQHQGMNQNDRNMHNWGMKHSDNHSGMRQDGDGVGMQHQGGAWYQDSGHGWNHQGGMGGCGSMNSSYGMGSGYNQNGWMARH